MIEETIRSQAPKNGLMAGPSNRPSRTTAQRSFRSALSQLRSGHCSRLQSYRHSVGWADDNTCPECRSTRPHGGPLLQLSHSSHGSGHGGYVDCTPPGSPIPDRAPTVKLPAPIADHLRLLSFITLIPAAGRLLPGYQWDSIILNSCFTPLHLICGPGVISPLRYPTTTLGGRYNFFPS